MLRKLEISEFERWVEPAYTLALDTERSGYPTYTDGIKTKEDFISRARKAFTRENEEILLYLRNGAVAGWIHYFALPEDLYLDTCSFCIAEGMREAVEEFVGFAAQRFPGYTLYLGFPEENREAVTALTALCFTRIEESYNDAIALADHVPGEGKESGALCGNVAAVTLENYPLFAALHDQHTDMYWNSERILADLDEWQIFILEDAGRAVGAVYFMLFEDRSMDEIFGIDFIDGRYDSRIYRTLLGAALDFEKARGARYLVFFNEEESQADALACGFRCVGKYLCYKKELRQ